MAWAVFFKWSFKGNSKVLTSSNVCLPLLVGRVEDIEGKSQLPDMPRVSSEKPQIPNTLSFCSENSPIPAVPSVGCVVFGTRHAFTWLGVSWWMTYSNTLNSDSRPLFFDEQLYTWCSMSNPSWHWVKLVSWVAPVSDFRVLSHHCNLAIWHFWIWSSSSNPSMSLWAVTNSFLRPSLSGLAASYLFTLVAKLPLSLQILANISVRLRVSK